MALYTYTAMRAGEKIEGTREAPDKHALVEILKQEGATALSIDVSRGRGEKGKLNFSMNMTIPFLSRVPNSEKILFARNLSAMIAAGLPLSRALAVLEKQTKNVIMKKTIAGVSADVRAGNTFHAALRGHPKVFSPLFVAMAHAGEESGTLSQALQVVATQMERSYTLTKKVRGAMIYPAIVITVMLAIFVLMLIFVVPTLSATFQSLNAQLPLPTQIVLGLSNFIITNTLLVAILIVLVVVGFATALRSAPGKRAFDFALLYMPIIGAIVAKVNAARTARTLSSLLAAGVSALQALEITESVVQNSIFRPIIAHAHELVEKGKPMSEAFVEAEKIYPVMFAEMSAVGEETGDMPGMLARVADFYEEDVEQETKDLSTIVEPILMVVIGAGVGFFAIAMIMPIYSLSNSIS
ncbi:MAG: type II secretion system F family protein [Patescibacteria group bacterium]|nr:type II secretion system F family protein [Patescibacteria group bacterium]